MKMNDLDTGKYASKISKKASKIETKAKSNKIRRLVFLCIILLACLIGSYIGISNKTESIETQYKEYLESPDRSMLNNELISYKDVSEQFEATFLGNKAAQSLMGGFFYSGSNCSIYPNNTGDKMMLQLGKSELTLCNGLASDVNVRDGIVYYRKLNARKISTYNLSNKTKSSLPLNNVGQFVVCENEIYYIDLSSSALLAYDTVTAESNEFVHSGVLSFAIIGNSIFTVDENHTLNEFSLSDHSITTVGKNISEFSYNGMLWIQNNEKVYTKALDEKSIKDVELGFQCNRLLGATDSHVFFESADGIYIYSIETGLSEKITSGVFVGATDNTILVYNSSNGVYKTITVD